MYSELICVGADGKLYQWKWEDPLPYQEQDAAIYHPRVRSLGLADEKVVAVSASSIRASVLTETGKVCATYSTLADMAMTELVLVLMFIRKLYHSLGEVVAN